MISPQNSLYPQIFIFLLLAGSSLAVKKCMVDMCKVCKDTKTQTCSTCETGFHLRSFTGTEKGNIYNHCYKDSTWWWYAFFILSSIILTTLSFVACFLIGNRYINFGQDILNSNRDKIPMDEQNIALPSEASPPGTDYDFTSQQGYALEQQVFPNISNPDFNKQSFPSELYSQQKTALQFQSQPQPQTFQQQKVESQFIPAPIKMSNEQPIIRSSPQKNLVQPPIIQPQIVRTANQRVNNQQGQMRIQAPNLNSQRNTIGVLNNNKQLVGTQRLSSPINRIQGQKIQQPIRKISSREAQRSQSPTPQMIQRAQRVVRQAPRRVQNATDTVTSPARVIRQNDQTNQPSYISPGRVRT